MIISKQYNEEEGFISACVWKQWLSQSEHISKTQPDLELISKDSSVAEYDFLETITKFHNNNEA